MIDDELNRLLNDIDENADFTEARQSKLQNQKTTARKSDKNTGTDFAGQSLQQYNQLIFKLKSDKDILLFNNGYINIFNIHLDSSKQLELAINDINLPDTVIDTLRKYKYSYLRNIENIIKYYNDFISSQSDSNLKKKAKLDYNFFFTDQEYSDNKIDFLVLKEIFLRLREYNSFIRKEFSELRNSIDGLSILNDGKDLYNKLSDIISRSLSYCGKTDRFISYIGLVLSIADSDVNVLEKDIYNRIFYRDSLKYDYSSLFDHSPLNLKEENTDEIIPDIKPRIKEQERVKPPAASVKPVSIKSKIPENIDADMIKFSPPGKSVWNTKEPYVIFINREAYLRNVEDLHKSIYFTASTDDVKLMNANVKRAMLRNVSGSQKEITDDYYQFINNTIRDIYSVFSDKLEVKDSLIDLIVYHMGPENIFKIIKNIFDSDQIGLCFKEIGPNKLSRFTPDEVIKVHILNWFEETINTKDLPFNSIQDFNDLKSLVEEKYKDMLNLSMTKIDHAAELYLKQSGKVIDKNTLLRRKSRELFSLPMIFLFKRFLERTIF
ncbi:MAG: hypothetical protein JW982_05560 [Spirochaetes bacterium]|nr:hypothetical protein [Spirochaetota bacterium]